MTSGHRSGTSAIGTTRKRKVTVRPCADTSLRKQAACYVNRHGSRRQMAANEPGILLMHNDLQKCLGNASVIGPAAASDSRLLAPDFRFDGERSRNVIHTQGDSDLSRSQGAEQGVTRARISPSHGSDGYNRKSTGYSGANGKIRWQAGMSRLMSDVRGYVGGYSQ